MPPEINGWECLTSVSSQQQTQKSSREDSPSLTYVKMSAPINHDYLLEEPVPFLIKILRALSQIGGIHLLSASLSQ